MTRTTRIVLFIGMLLAATLLATVACGSSQPVSNGNGNPMSEGQSIKVSVNKGDLDVSGDVDITMLDTQSKAFTFFSFTAADSKPDTAKLQQAIIYISTSGPNGEKKISDYGTSR